ncbi:MAG: hypothetical protein DI556_09710 [Rhodovulum sulfidophilum]|uniref:Uncharacterized protein n=1 Tax=Rhodovulum sulfidophilum TaxID=35806 RepID=A0A2W5PXW6_RHOSU|nr:MAG: hypothetical protein DI556_09710 [Rhodovulum sulfidophilum]
MTRIVMERCDDLSMALNVYTALSQERGGVDLVLAIDGSERAKLPHRASMPKNWFGCFHTMIGLCDGDTSLLDNVTDLFSGIPIDGWQPSLEAMLCAAEDYVMIFDAFPISDMHQDAPPEEENPLYLVNYALMVAKSGGLSSRDLDALACGPGVVTLDDLCSAIEAEVRSRRGITAVAQ